MRQFIQRKSILNDECLINVDFSADGSIEFPNHVRKTVKKQTLSLFMNLVSDMVRVKAIESANNQQIKDIIKILMKKKQQKTLKELVLLKYVFRNINFFISLDQKIGDVSDSIYSNLNHETYPANTQLFQVGDHPDKFYIILRGEVVFLKQKQEEEKPLTHENKQLMRLKRMGTFFSTAMAAQKQDKETQQMESFKTQFPDLTFSKKLKQGQSFFETSLSFKRPSSEFLVLCTQDTDLATITQDDFLSFLQEYYFLQARDNIKFLSALTVFQDWSDYKRGFSITKYITPLKNFAQYIFLEGQQAEYVYLVREGEIEITRTQKTPKTNIDLEPNLISLLIPYKRDNLTCKSKTLRLGLISVGEFFGLTETLEGGIRDCSAQCKSNTAEDIFQNFPQTIDTLRQQSNLIEKSRERPLPQELFEEKPQNVQMRFNLKINRSRRISRVTSTVKKVDEETFIRKVFHQPGTSTARKLQLLNHLNSRQSIVQNESSQKLHRQRYQSISVRPTSQIPNSFLTHRSNLHETLTQYQKSRQSSIRADTMLIKSLPLSQRPQSQKGYNLLSQSIQ